MLSSEISPVLMAVVALGAPVLIATLAAAAIALMSLRVRSPAMRRYRLELIEHLTRLIAAVRGKR